MNERFLMSSVMTAGIADVYTSLIGFSQGIEEGGLLAGYLVEKGDVDGAIWARIGVAALLVGLYALNKEFPNKYSEAIDKGVRAGNLYAWSVAALNAIFISMR